MLSSESLTNQLVRTGKKEQKNYFLILPNNPRFHHRFTDLERIGTSGINIAWKHILSRMVRFNESGFP